MKLLLDENLPHDLRHEIVGHNCVTTAYQGWGGKKNGELLQLAADAAFDALVTQDSSLPYQQDTHNLPVAVILLVAPTNKLADLRPLLPKLLVALESLTPNSVTVVQ
ncbi:MAG: DUF5615 family PIN-like protein [Planctomycetota bacterium]